MPVGSVVSAATTAAAAAADLTLPTETWQPGEVAALVCLATVFHQKVLWVRGLVG